MQPYLTRGSTQPIDNSEAELDMDWINPRIGLDWIGWNDCDLVSVRNYCSTVDVVSYKNYDLRTLNYSGFTTIKSQHQNSW